VAPWSRKTVRSQVSLSSKLTLLKHRLEVSAPRLPFPRMTATGGYMLKPSFGRAGRGDASARTVSEGAGCTIQTSRKCALRIAFRIEQHVPALLKLHHKHRDRPMSLADACIVRMAEIHERHAVLTLDSNFTVYRKSGRVPLEIIHPTQG
jgi:hypothetical protein